MANRIIRVTGATFGGTTCDGLRTFAFDFTRNERRGRSDAELGETSADTVTENLTGYCGFDDEDADLDQSGDSGPTLMGATTGVLVVSGKEDGGDAVTITIGLAAAGTGVFFNGSEGNVDNTPGRPPEVRLTWLGKYSSSITKTIGSAAEVAAGTALMSIVAA